MVGSRLAVHRTILVVDVERFGDPSRSSLDRLVVRDGVYRALTQALLAAGVPWSECDHEDRGDGVLVVISPAVAKTVLIESVPEALVSALEEHNHAHSAAERIGCGWHCTPGRFTMTTTAWSAELSTWLSVCSTPGG